MRRKFVGLLAVIFVLCAFFGVILARIAQQKILPDMINEYRESNGLLGLTRQDILDSFSVSVTSEMTKKGEKPALTQAQYLQNLNDSGIDASFAYVIVETYENSEFETPLFEKWIKTPEIKSAILSKEGLSVGYSFMSDLNMVYYVTVVISDYKTAEFGETETIKISTNQEDIAYYSLAIQNHEKSEHILSAEVLEGSDVMSVFPSNCVLDMWGKKSLSIFINNSKSSKDVDRAKLVVKIGNHATRIYNFEIMKSEKLKLDEMFEILLDDTDKEVPAGAIGLCYFALKPAGKVKRYMEDIKISVDGCVPAEKRIETFDRYRYPIFFVQPTDAVESTTHKIVVDVKNGPVLSKEFSIKIPQGNRVRFRAQIADVADNTYKIFDHTGLSWNMMSRRIDLSNYKKDDYVFLTGFNRTEDGKRMVEVDSIAAISSFLDNPDSNSMMKIYVISKNNDKVEVSMIYPPNSYYYRGIYYPPTIYTLFGDKELMEKIEQNKTYVIDGVQVLNNSNKMNEIYMKNIASLDPDNFVYPISHVTTILGQLHAVVNFENVFFKDKAVFRDGEWYVSDFQMNRMGFRFESSHSNSDATLYFGSKDYLYIEANSRSAIKHDKHFIMDEKVELDKAPFVEDKTLYIPIFSVFKAMGVDYKFNDETKELTFTIN